MMTDQENASARVRDFLAARESMGGSDSKTNILIVGVNGQRYALTREDLRILSGWDGEPMKQRCAECKGTGLIAPPPEEWRPQRPCGACAGSGVDDEG